MEVHFDRICGWLDVCLYIKHILKCLHENTFFQLLSMECYPLDHRKLVTVTLRNSLLNFSSGIQTFRRRYVAFLLIICFCTVSKH